MGIDWIKLVQDKVQWLILVEREWNFRVQKKE
jgi:hypothetical protein